MSLINYEIFEAVVKHQSFLRASEILKLSPSAISHSISKLEDTIGFPLFIRSKTGVQLTNSGKELLPYIRTILNDVENLNQRVAQLNGLEKGTVRIGTINSVCVSWLPDIIRSFAKLYPGIELNIFQGGYDDVVSWLHSNTVDIGFISISHADSLQVTPVYKDQLLCIVPKGFQPLHSGYITSKDIENQNIVRQREGYDTETNEFINKHGLTVTTQFHIVDDQSLIAMVESGFGISIMPELAIKHLHISNVDSYIFKPEEYRILGLASMNKQFLSPAASRLQDYVLKYLEDNKIMNV